MQMKHSDLEKPYQALNGTHTRWKALSLNREMVPNFYLAFYFLFKTDVNCRKEVTSVRI